MINNKKIAAVIQARGGGTRLPGKVLLDLAGKPALQQVIERLRQAKTLDDIIIATTTNPDSDLIASLCEKLGCNYFRGSEEDVLTRVLEAAKAYEVDVIVEITADCPMVDWGIVDQLVSMYCNSDYDYCSNVAERTFPRGYDCQVFSTKLLEQVNAEVDNPIDRQHVSTWIYKNPKNKGKFKLFNLSAGKYQYRPDLEITLDTPEDLELIRWLFEYGKEYRIDMTCQDVINAIDTYPHVYKKVAETKRKDYFLELDEAYKEQTKHGLEKVGQLLSEGSEKKSETKVKGVSKKRGKNLKN